MEHGNKRYSDSDSDSILAANYTVLLDCFYAPSCHQQQIMSQIEPLNDSLVF
jgi:hypothetical protein